MSPCYRRRAIVALGLGDLPWLCRPAREGSPEVEHLSKLGAALGRVEVLEAQRVLHELLEALPRRELAWLGLGLGLGF